MHHRDATLACPDQQIVKNGTHASGRRDGSVTIEHVSLDINEKKGRGHRANLATGTVQTPARVTAISSSVTAYLENVASPAQHVFLAPYGLLRSRWTVRPSVRCRRVTYVAAA
jgi:hypothetical protein